jgi:hypothetical protein
MFKRRTIFYILIFSLPILIFSCNKDPDRIGIDLQPDEDKLEVFVSDTTSIYAYSVLVDSVRTDETTLSMLGSYFDPVFGSSTSSIYTQIRLSTTSVDFGENPALDSIILAFEYTGDYYGDTSYMQNFMVFRIGDNDSINGEIEYYSNQHLELAEELANVYIQPSPTDSVMVDTLRYKAQLRIPLSQEFGESILNAPSDDLSSNDNFLTFLRGVYVTSGQMQWGGAIFNFDLVSANSKMTIYYSNDENDSLSYPFAISAGNARFMNFEQYNYENATASFKAQVIDGDTTLGDNILFIQSMAGVKVRFKFPYLKDWVKNNNIAVNEARLTINDAYPNSNFIPPNELVVLKRNDDGTSGLIPDQFEGTAYFGGQYDPATGEYYFRISRYIQYLLSDDAQDYGLELVVSGGSLMPNRGMLIGPNPDPGSDLSKRLKLNLIYTDLKN